MNKKAETSTIGVTITIILGIALIVFLIWGFSTNWSMFEATAGAYAGKTNIDTVKKACQLQCQGGRETEFCSVKKDLIKADGTKLSQYSCGQLAVVLGDSGFACDSLCKFEKEKTCQKIADAPEGTDCSVAEEQTCADKGPNCAMKETGNIVKV